MIRWKRCKHIITEGAKIQVTKIYFEIILIGTLPAGK
jgi:hypothetical protein